MSRVLILGSGGREHAISKSISNDKNVDKIFCAPGNPGTKEIGENVELDIKNNTEILEFINSNNISLTIVGPEQPLENGVVDFIDSKGYKIFGPTRFSAQLETSKLFARDFMEKYQIPQPSYFKCSTEEEVVSVSTKLGFPIVLKADGLAAGKGVIICNNPLDLDEAMDIMFKEKKFGKAAEFISVEECLKGEEVSIFIISDGENYKILNSAQDHKRIFNDDKGANTGGMGAYCPSPLLNKELIENIEKTIIKPTIKGMKNEGSPYKGFLYVGLMLTNGKPYVIEFNARMGDPETQVVLPMMNNSIYSLINASFDSSLKEHEIINKNGYCVTVVLAASGYPDNYNTNILIKGLDKISSEMYFHAGTSIDNNQNYYSNGGRVLNILGYGDTLSEAIENAYSNVDKIKFDEMYFRTDIGQKGLNYIKELND